MRKGLAFEPRIIAYDRESTSYKFYYYIIKIAITRHYHPGSISQWMSEEYQLMTRFRHEISRAATLERNEASARRVVQAGPEVERYLTFRRLSPGDLDLGRFAPNLEADN